MLKSVGEQVFNPQKVLEITLPYIYSLLHLHVALLSMTWGDRGRGQDMGPVTEATRNGPHTTDA